MLPRAAADIMRAGSIQYCVFHLEPAPAMLVFICVITRPFLVFGVFVGLFMGVRRYFFRGGSFWRNRAILRPF